MKIIRCFALLCWLAATGSNATLISEIGAQIAILEQMDDNIVYRNSHNLSAFFALLPQIIAEITARFLPTSIRYSWFDDICRMAYDYANPMILGLQLGTVIGGSLHQAKQRIRMYINSLERLRALLAVAKQYDLIEMNEDELREKLKRSTVLGKALKIIEAKIAIKFEGDNARKEVSWLTLLKDINQRNNQPHWVPTRKYEVFWPKIIPFGKIQLYAYDAFLDLLVEDFFLDENEKMNDDKGIEQ